MIICVSHVTHSPNAGNMAAVQEPLRNGDVANFTLGQMELENISVIREEVIFWLNILAHCPGSNFGWNFVRGH